MRKFTYIITTIISFLFITNVYALTKIDDLNINVALDDNGDAIVNEVWVLSNNDSYIARHFELSKDAKISDIVVTSNDINYKENNSKGNNTYSFENNNKINIYSKEKTINLSYKVHGMVVKYKDVQGLSWQFIRQDKNVMFRRIRLEISGNKPFDKNNTGITVFGTNLYASFDEGKIIVTSRNLRQSHFKIICSFTNEIFANPIKLDMTYAEDCKQSTNTSKAFMSTKRILLSLIILIIIILLFILLLRKFKNNNNKEFKNIKNNIQLNNISDIPYLDNVPFNNIHKISFIATYFNIQKNRSDLVGTFLLKWIFDGLISVRNDDKYELVIQKDVYPTDLLERELFEIIKGSTANGIIDTAKINRLSNTKGERIISWYKSSVESVLDEEVIEGNIIRRKKHKKYYYEITNKMLIEVNYIQGLKKYILNFNQVPRKSELTIENFKSLLLVSELLGIGKLFAEEILRKSSDNELAQVLKDFEDHRVIFRSIYSNALESTKKKKKKVEEDE